jgi:hypothetical protein
VNAGIPKLLPRRRIETEQKIKTVSHLHIHSCSLKANRHETL